MDYITPTKNCTRCSTEKSPDDFPINKRAKDGRNAWCKQCTNEYSREHFIKNREKRVAQIREYHKDHPEISRNNAKQWREKYPEKRTAYVEANKEHLYRKQREWSEANRNREREKYKRYDDKNKDKKLQYRQLNHSKLNETKKLWRKNNSEKYLETERQYRKKRPEIFRENARRRRALKKGAPVIEKIDRATIIQRDKSICYLCGKSLYEK